MPKTPRRRPNGSRVAFRLRALFHPGTHQVLMDLHGDEEIEGTVVDQSAHSDSHDTFDQIQVDGLSYCCLVADADVRDVSDDE